MNRFRIVATSMFAVLIFAILSCNDPLQIGTELLDQGDVSFEQTDTITVQAVTTEVDSIIAFQSPDFIFSNHRLGWVGDPVFGSHRSEIVTQLIPESFLRPEGNIDSVVLYISYDTLGVYGDANSTYDLAVLGLDERLSGSDTYYTDDLAAASSMYGGVVGMPFVDRDSVQVIGIENGDRDTSYVVNQMRLPLNTSLGDQLFNLDSLDYTSVDSFFQAFNGIVIRPTSINGGMLSTILTRSKISVFYNNTDDGLGQFDYFLGGAGFSAHQHDHSSGTIDGYIDNETLSKELLYLQGAGGPSISVKFPFLADQSGIVVNEAILELTTELLSQDDREKYPLPGQLYTSYKEDGSLILTSDVSRAFQQFGDLELFGGTPVEITSGGSTRIIYQLNLSEHIQSMISGEVSDEIFIQLSQNSNSVERVIFNGINASENPLKLKITYTEI